MKICEVVSPIELRNPEIGLMTKEEFLYFQNKKDKHHSNLAYDFTVDGLNQPGYQEIFTLSGGEQIYHDKNMDVIHKAGKMVAIIMDGTLFRLSSFSPNRIPSFYRNDRNEYDLRWEREEIFKYEKELKAIIIQDQARKNREERYPVLINRKKFGNEVFEFRTKELPYQENGGGTIAVLREDGLKVGFASDEWGASLLVVAREYRGTGIGNHLGRMWFQYNPKWLSGGFTPKGERAALKIWGDRVRELLSRGWYGDLVKRGIVTKDRVQEILSGIPPKNRHRSSSTIQRKEEPLFMIFDYGFIIYDRAIYDDEDEDEKWIYAYGFFRDFNGDMFLYRLDYEDRFRRIAHLLAFSIARKKGFDVLVKSPPSDYLELKSVPEIEVNGDYARLRGKALDLNLLSRHEKEIRKSLDQYDQKYYRIQELADTKWS